MQVYLPIAEMSVDALLLLGIGFGVGWLSGLFGVGGGFLLTPVLILIGIPAPVAVASGANQTLGASVSGLIAQWRRDNVDARMGVVLLTGGLLGSLLGVQLFAALRKAGQVDLAVSFFYVVVLGTVGALMVRESVRAIFRRRRAGAAAARAHEHTWLHGLPFKLRFRKSRLYISIVPPLAVGFGIGILSAIMGVGGGFMLVPAMIYLLGMPTSDVVRVDNGQQRASFEGGAIVVEPGGSVQRLTRRSARSAGAVNGSGPDGTSRRTPRSPADL
jgi:uncharacterized membrane protein YfcA